MRASTRRRGRGWGSGFGWPCSRGRSTSSTGRPARACSRRRRPSLSCPLVGPPVLLDLGVAGAGTRRADREQLEPVGPGLEGARRVLRHAHRIPLAEVDDLVLELDPAAARENDVDLLLRLVPVPEGPAE